MPLRKLKSIPEEIRGKIVTHIEKVLSRREEILFAFIYGSFIRKDEMDRYGDIDVAVYPLRSVEDKESYFIEAGIEKELWEDLASSNLDLLPVEVINLRLAPYRLRVSLLRHPYLMIKKDEDAFTSFIEETSSLAMANNHLRKESIREVLEEMITGGCSKRPRIV